MAKNTAARLRMRRKRSPDHGAGFTLVELLSVIAVVGILTTILLPAVHRVREQAGRVQSVSNLRQLGTAMKNFQADNNWRIPPLADWTWAHQNQRMWGGKSWDFYLWKYLDVPGADPTNIHSPPPDQSFEQVLFHPGDTAEDAGNGLCRRSYAMAWTPPLGIFPGDEQAIEASQVWGGPLVGIAFPSRVIMLTERPGHTGNVAGEGAYADIVKPADQTAMQSLHSDGKFNYLFWDGHVETLTPLETTGRTQDLNHPGGYWTTDPADDFEFGS